MTSDFVVEESLHAFDRGQLMVIPGWRYKIIAGFMRAMPKAWLRKLSSAGVRRYRKPH